MRLNPQFAGKVFVVKKLRVLTCLGLRLSPLVIDRLHASSLAFANVRFIDAHTVRLT